MTIDEFKKNIAPHMNKGWVAMDKNGEWWWFDMKPCLTAEKFLGIGYCSPLLDFFDIEPVEDWIESLMRCGDE